MQITADDYPELKAFLAWAMENLRPVTPGLPPELHPVAVLEDFESRSMAMARKGLDMAIGDLVEDLSELTGGQIQAVDAALRADGIVTLTEVRARYWLKIRRIRRRGLVRNDEEYSALRNVVEAMPEDERAKAWELLAAYEEKAVAR